MHLTLDCEFNHFLIEALEFNAASNLSLNNHALSQLLSKAVVQPLNVPLEALISTQFGLINAPDYPIAAIAAAIDGLEVADKYWLRADPVHLVLQRDCFSLGEPIPLHVDIAQANHMVATLNQHLNQDGLTILIGESGAWYIASDEALQVETTLPSVAADKNIHSFLPQGVQAAKWL